MPFCQVKSSTYADTYKEEVDKNIFRVMSTLGLDESQAITACYEHEIYKPLSFLLKAGPSLTGKFTSKDAFGNEQYAWSVRAVASAEVRCYYNLKRRVRHEKTIRNFSGYYISLEPFVISNPLIIVNDPNNDLSNGKAGIYLNIGFQKQVRHFYFNAFFGTRFFGQIYSNSNSFLDVIQAGVTIGRAF